ncbi:hypothetical protein JGU66_00490 [Myxococcaceae bacterium JPH2]|nr:hypothetical protein [Myxococcaceae bacterium JPH2]
MMRWTGALALAALATGCTNNKPPERSARAQVRAIQGAQVEVLPAEGQLPYCLLYSMSEKGVIRQLTMTRENQSVRCEPQKPIGHTRFRIPVQEGKVRLFVFFTDDPIPAGPVAQQLFDLRNQDRISAMDLRLPGKVFVETLEFTPHDGGDAGHERGSGSVVLSDGGTSASADAGADTVLPIEPEED